MFQRHKWFHVSLMKLRNTGMTPLTVKDIHICLLSALKPLALLFWSFDYPDPRVISFVIFTATYYSLDLIYGP